MPFDFEHTDIENLIVIKPRVFHDQRGFFMESYKLSEFQAAGIKVPFVQANHSHSVKNVLRGLHFQRSPNAQAKLVRCIAGRVWDVAVDLRKGSKTYGKWYGIELTAENRTMLYIPAGFAHGFLTLSETADFVYQVSAEYAPESDGGVRWDDPDISIQWPVLPAEVLVSEKDNQLPSLDDLEVPYL